MTPEQKEEARRIALRRMEERHEFWQQHDLRLALRDAEPDSEAPPENSMDDW